MRKGLRLGLDVGGTQVKMALVNERGRTLETTQVNTVREPRALVRALRSAAEGWLSRSLLGTGVGVAGDTDPQRGIVRFSPNLRWRNVPLARLIRGAGFPGPVWVDNDATVAAWGALHVECGARTRNLVVLTLGTGVGGGLVFDRQLYRGATGTAGEVGHLVVEAGGEPCVCGNRGCLEAYLGGASLVRWASAAYGAQGRSVAPLDPRILEERARRGDRIARAAWRRGARALGTALTGLVNLLNPDTILLTGGVSRGAPLFLPEALRILKSHAFKTSVRAVRVGVSRRTDLGVVGAALLVK